MPDTQTYTINETIPKSIANKFGIKEQITKDFINLYFQTVSQVDKLTWVYDYETKNHLVEESKYNVVDWARSKLKFNRVFPVDQTGWNLILETYLRSYITNLVRNELKYYLTVQTGYEFKLTTWSLYVTNESTCLDSKTKYMVYQSEQQSSLDQNVYFLTPIKLEWLSKLNPIFCYYYVTNGPDFIKSFSPDYPFLPQIREMVKDVERVFSKNDLIEFIGQLGDPAYLKVIMRSLK